ncbi:MAG TPA: hypothetical protein VJ276_06050 [Thermoanaerobaculia bacterium]|nr:hypothetical protein [Thermoanaerobaculia bacterium]
MKRTTALAAMLLGLLVSFSASAQLQYFGYVFAEDAAALARTKSYTNFTHVAASIPNDPDFLAKVNTINSRGLKVTIDLGKIFWCNAPQYDRLCSGTTNSYRQRWDAWKAYNQSILTPDKVVALTVRDEPILFGSSMADVETAAAYIKSDPALSWIKIFYVESGCKIKGDYCGAVTDGNNGFANASNVIPSIDWIGVNDYGLHPATDSGFQLAVNRMRNKFPGKKWLYVADGFWNAGHEQSLYPLKISDMGTIAREWYDVARADPNAVLLGVFSWNDVPDELITGSQGLPCNVLQEHAAIGRAITGKTRGAAPIGTYSIDSLGVVSGWTCDPDQSGCDSNPVVDVFADGVRVARLTTPYNDTSFTNLQCGTDKAFRFKYAIPRNTAGKTISVVSDDADTTGATVTSTCPQAPNCSWVSHLKYFGYSGSADETNNRGLDETKGFTNFSHIAVTADPADTTLRDRVAAMNARGLKATIDLGQLLWCGTNYRALCSNWQTRWSTWKTTNASILTSDKVLALVPRAEPFNYAVSMTQYDQAAAFIKADATVGSWIKLWLVEAACVVANDDCGAYPGSHAWGLYTGALPSIDWIGLNAYAINPSSDPVYQEALDKMKSRFPSKPRLYVMDGFWDDAHATAFGTISEMKNVAREYYDLAHNDPQAILLGVYSWPQAPDWTTSRDFPCYVLSEHRDIGREITLKTRTRLSSPTGKLENIYDGSGTLIGNACDPDGSICENPVIDLYKDGVFFRTTTNYPSRSDYVTNAQCPAGLSFRFRDTMPQSASGFNITARARDIDSGTVTLASGCAENPACLWFSYKYPAKGYMQALSPTGVAAGWVCDPDAPQLSTKVRLALANGTPIGTYTTNLNSEQAVADECRGGYVHRFSVQLPTWARYNTIHAFALDVITGDEVLIPWLCEPGGYECTWY